MKICLCLTVRQTKIKAIQVKLLSNFQGALRNLIFLFVFLCDYFLLEKLSFAVKTFAVRENFDFLW